ncbi:hypothetical protein FHR24_001476 [Wenyingzhuangia heitensis]|uniref:Uncharacterized protein n=1 Tax=Wenyingzhuangia heitensis TaxID=1487859 RepID=A0ABX0U857_9FLAO|nr:hypothetical protein [Wenyingzhuangia heitensis]
MRKEWIAHGVALIHTPYSKEELEPQSYWNNYNK